ncbi:MAG: TIGR03667 family PPOX class F420-dependent oxidoreductase [Anaerolineales bacterium]|nr:TIGR03667 family PPOX class F420-dependent oxidoreductase [Anaerolineales bacterium]
MIDLTTEFGQRVARRLREESVIWLTTVRRDGTPQPTPVWFLWDGAAFLIFSEPRTQKLRNIAAHPRVALHFDSDGAGGDIIVFRGVATVGVPPTAAQLEAYLEKYQEGIKELEMTPQDFTGEYTVPILVKPEGLSGHV